MLRQLVVVILGLGLMGLIASPAEAVSPNKRNAAATAAQHPAIQQAMANQAMLNQMMVAKKKRHRHPHRKPIVTTVPAVR
jgi:hypothetical protein